MSDGSEIAARTVIIATGVTWRRLDAPGLEALHGAGVYYGAAGTEAPAMEGGDVFVVGAGNSAVGDVRAGSVKRVASAAGAGAIAVQLVHEYLSEARG